MRKLEKTDANRSNNKKPFAIALEAKNSLEQTLFKLNTHLNGLTEEDARERLELYGINQVAHEKAPPAFLQLLAAFNNPFILFNYFGVYQFLYRLLAAITRGWGN